MKKNTYHTIEEIKKKLELYCVYQERCHKEVEKKLSEFSLIEEAKNQILLHLLSNDFLNEERFSKSFARGKFSIKKWGKQRIIRELKIREISAYNIEAGLHEINMDDYFETLCFIAKKKNALISEENTYKRKQKLINYLARKGYEYSLIYEVVNDVV